MEIDKIGGLKILEVLKLFLKKFYHSLGHLLIGHSIAIALKGQHFCQERTWVQAQFSEFSQPILQLWKGEVETSSHYLLHCSKYPEEHLALLKFTRNILAFFYWYLLVTLLLTIIKILLSLIKPEDLMNLYAAVLD